MVCSAAFYHFATPDFQVGIYHWPCPVPARILAILTSVVSQVSSGTYQECTSTQVMIASFHILSILLFADIQSCELPTA
jgi:hypothetical protein